ncbi:hypothetical protein I7I50_09502 [Histoplasma capsulatum G186AR]|uniref:Uncharacterized protein n=1 Tax=Ajellomyces capsulatus TaxID=5037 RepID=A0A8H8D1G4_AJECA|nr:hypothetical protein I7I52_07023 [Histoplasma capsulatum]QSS74371.1 hypothetical protein I7I50_09502 [Histoplasma capsulatum G186AR]
MPASPPWSSTAQPSARVRPLHPVQPVPTTKLPPICHPITASMHRRWRNGMVPPMRCTTPQTPAPQVFPKHR